MLRFFLIFVTILHLFDSASSEDYDSLPTIKIITLKSRKIPPKRAAYKTEYSCPAETTEEINNLKIAADNQEHKSPELSYCVFSRSIKDSNNTNRKCKREISPIFLLSQDKDSSLINCGSSENQQLYSFGFYHCGNRQKLEEFNREEVRENPTKYFTRKPKIVENYEVCYDTSTNAAIWTQHKMTHPIIFEKFDGRSESLTPGAISTDGFLLKNTNFEQIKRIYELQDEKTPLLEHKMQPQPLVPPEHFVFRIWKKTTNHIINTAPLLENLVPLMSAINIGLKKAQMKLYILNPTSSYVRLRFYTRVTSLSLPPLIDENPSFEQLLQPSIWHKFIYHEVEKKGLLIYIHNTLEEPSTDQRKCEDVVQCEFDRWSNDFPTTVLIQENLQNFAYCCSVTSEHIKEIFFIDVEIKGTLDLNGLISKGRKRQRRNISDMFPNQKITQIAEGSKSKQESTMKTKSRGRPRKHIKEEKISESSSKNVPVKDSKHLEKSKRNKTRDTRSKSNTRNISEIPAEDETVKGSKNKEGSRRNKVRDKKSRHRKISELFSDDVVAVGDPDN